MTATGTEASEPSSAAAAGVVDDADNMIVAEEEEATEEEEEQQPDETTASSTTKEEEAMAVPDPLIRREEVKEEKEGDEKLLVTAPDEEDEDGTKETTAAAAEEEEGGGENGIPLLQEEAVVASNSGDVVDDGTAAAAAIPEVPPEKSLLDDEEEEDVGEVVVEEEEAQAAAPAGASESGEQSGVDAAAVDGEYSESFAAHGDGDGGAAAEATWTDDEERALGGEVLFERTSPAAYSGWDNLRWLSYSGVRKVRFCQPCYRLVESETKQLFWSKTGQSYVPRVLVVYDEPRLILVLRRPNSLEEVHAVLGLPDIAEIDDSEHATDNYFVVESVVDPAFTKLRLSPLTTPTSVVPDGSADERRRSCVELITPAESIHLSAVRVRSSIKPNERSFSDSGSFLETVATETALVQAIVGAQDLAKDIGIPGTDISWKHQLILGTVHSLVVSGDGKALDEVIQTAKSDPALPLSRVVDGIDDSGLTPLYYACARRMVHAVNSLVSAGAKVDVKVGSTGMTLAHVCARNLDHNRYVAWE